ncbi:MAG TPA: carbonic anhydrase family protein [Chitinophagaceae bacterium]
MRTFNKELQQQISPIQALEILKEGNKRFVSNLKMNRNLLQQVNETRDGQWPFAVVLSCIDSRTSAELVFDQGLGDIFSIRIAGNIVNDDIIGSMEFGCKAAGAKIIVVLGHTRCGAVKGACDGVKLGSLTGLLGKIQPSIDLEHETLTERNASNAAFVENVAAINVHRTAISITEKSAILNEMVERGEIGIVGAMYDVSTGRVEFYEDTIQISNSRFKPAEQTA